jgi:hypothetical protein
MDAQRPVLARRLRRLPRARLLDVEVPVAVGLQARLFGLSFLPLELAGAGLLIPRCRCVHTFGMRFALGIVFLDPSGAAISRRDGVRPGRIVSDRRAAAVLELPAA